MYLICTSFSFFLLFVCKRYGRKNIIEGTPSIIPFKIRTSQVALASDDSYQLSMWELGTQNFEALAGIEQCVEYIASIGARFGSDDGGGGGGDGKGDGGDGEGDSTNRRKQIVAGWKVVREHENRMKIYFLNKANSMKKLHVYGITDPTRVSERTATFGISVDGLHPEKLCQLLTDAGIYCTSGNHYCTFWNNYYSEKGLNDVDGVTRIGFLHYNTMEDVKRVLETLEKICR